VVFVLANVTKLSMALLEAQRRAETGLASLRGVEEAELGEMSPRFDEL
jgi:hypothetical protein